MNKKLLLFFGTLVALFLLVIFVGSLFFAYRIFRSEGVASRVVIDATFSGVLAEDVPDDPIARIFMEDVTTTLDVVSALDRAAGDDRVVALVAKIDTPLYGVATMQEVRDAVIRFRESGKPAIAWAETFGEFGPGNGAYYLASAFDSIYLLPSGDVGLVGLNLETPFIRGLLDKLEVTPQFDQRHEYKNAMNFYTETSFTDAHREALEALLASIFDQFVEGMASGRDMEASDVRALIDRGPFLGPEALEAGLVDDLIYEDEVDAIVDDLAGANAKRLSLTAYRERSGGAYESGPKVALIYGYGGVMRGENGYDAANSSPLMGSDTVSRAFRDAVDDDVRAILFRIDCPGGSYVASDIIWREVVRAREAGIPVIVSMGNVAASGGYFVAMDATKIVAQPGTITGSIGVLAGKLVLDGLYDKFGLSFGSIQTSDNAEMWSVNERFDDAEWKRFQAWLDRIYEDFTNRVSTGRDIPIEEVRDIAKGRVWSGEAALEHDLVDALGGIPTAIELAKSEAGIPERSSIRLQRYPSKPSFMDLLLDRASGRELVAVVRAARTTVEAFGPYLKAARRITEPSGPVTMPPIELDGR